MKIAKEGAAQVHEEIKQFKTSATLLNLSPHEWIKLREACLAKFGTLDKFKEWQRGKAIQFKLHE